MQRNAGTRSTEGEDATKRTVLALTQLFVILFFTGSQQPFCLTLTTLASAFPFARIDRYVAARFRARRSR
jgi:hypothetical protein